MKQNDPILKQIPAEAVQALVESGERWVGRVDRLLASDSVERPSVEVGLRVESLRRRRDTLETALGRIDSPDTARALVEIASASRDVREEWRRLVRAIDRDALLARA